MLPGLPPPKWILPGQQCMQVMEWLPRGSLWGPGQNFGESQCQAGKSEGLATGLQQFPHPAGHWWVGGEEDRGRDHCRSLQQNDAPPCSVRDPSVCSSAVLLKFFHSGAWYLLPETHWAWHCAKTPRGSWFHRKQPELPLCPCPHSYVPFFLHPSPPPQMPAWLAGSPM